MRIKLDIKERDEFGAGWDFYLGWIQVSWLRYENHMYFAIQWVKPS